VRVVPSTAELLTEWTLTPGAALAIGAAGALYLSGVSRVAARGRHWSGWRGASFAAGLAVLVLATQSAIATRDEQFDVHVLQHVLLGMAAPFLLALGAPLTLAMQAAPRGAQVWIGRVVHSAPARVLSHPVVAGALFGLSLFALYFSPVYGWSVDHVLVHEAVHLHFFLVGALFFWVTVGLDPVANRVPYGARLALVVLTVPLHAFLGLALLSTTEPIGPPTQEAAARVRVERQHRGAALMWIVGDVVGLAAGGVVLAQWMAYEHRRGLRIDRALDAAAAR
jgi:putative copper resistance protein D